MTQPFSRLRPTRSDSAATVGLTLDAAMAMHRAFHLEREYVATNLCPCNGCTQASNLKLKFVAHIGEVATQTIRQRRKLVGIDVILVHRLLKNPVDVPEYVLLSDELYHAATTPLPGPAHEVAQDLEGIGPVRAYFVDAADFPASRCSPCRVRPCSDASGRTLAVAGAGMPYMLGLRRRRSTAAAF